MRAENYSQRILNPFRGVMNIIELDEADAVTTDGIHWTLYIHDDPDPWQYQDNLQADIVTPDIKYGTWSAEEGFRPAPVLSSMNYARIRREGGRLLEAIQASYQTLPFALKDKYELWLLDKETDLPLVLLDSACEEQSLYQDGSLYWNPGQRCKKMFRSAAVSRSGQSVCAGECIATLINSRAGDTPGAQWFWRDDDGTGFALGGINLDEAVMSRQLPAQAFPPLLLNTQWVAGETLELVYDFQAWLAPWLLLLQDISREQRYQLELEARKQAVLTASLYTLYPEIVDSFIFNAIRIEARLRQSEREEIREDGILSAFSLI